MSHEPMCLFSLLFQVLNVLLSKGQSVRCEPGMLMHSKFIIAGLSLMDYNFHYVLSGPKYHTHDELCVFLRASLCRRRPGTVEIEALFSQLQYLIKKQLTVQHHFREQ